MVILYPRMGEDGSHVSGRVLCTSVEERGKSESEGAGDPDISAARVRIHSNHAANYGAHYLHYYFSLSRRYLRLPLWRLITLRG